MKVHILPNPHLIYNTILQKISVLYMMEKYDEENPALRKTIEELVDSLLDEYISIS